MDELWSGAHHPLYSSSGVCNTFDIEIMDLSSHKLFLVVFRPDYIRIYTFSGEDMVIETF